MYFRSVLAALDSTVTNGDFKSTYHQYANVNYTEAWLNHTKPNKSEEENKAVIGSDFHHDHRDGKGNVFFGDYFDSGDLEDDEDYDDNVLLLEKEEQTSVSFKVSEELLAKIGHIDSSETSDESPESSSTAVKKKASAEEVQALPVVSAAAAAAPGNGGKRLSTVSGESYSARVTNRPSLHDSVKDSEPGSYPIDLNTIIYLIYKNECLVCILRAVVPHPFDCDKTLSTHCYRHSRKAIVKKKYFLNNFFFFNFKLTIRNAKFRFKKKKHE